MSRPPPTLEEIYLARHASSVSTSRPATSRTSKLQSAVSPQQQDPHHLMVDRDPRSRSASSSRRSSRPSSAHPSTRVPPPAPSSSSSAGRVAVPSSSRGSYAFTESSKFTHLLEDMDRMLNEAMQPVSPPPHQHPHQQPTHSQSVALLDSSLPAPSIPVPAAVSKPSRPASATVRGKSAERRAPPDVGAYMSRKGKTALQKMQASGQRDPTLGFAAWQAQQKAGKAGEEKESSPVATSRTVPFNYNAASYFQSYSVSQLQKELTSALDTIAQHESAAKQQEEYYAGRLAELEREAAQWKRMCELYRTGFGGQMLAAATAAASVAASTAAASAAAAHSRSSSAAASAAAHSRSPSKSAPPAPVHVDSGDDEYEDDTTTAPAPAPARAKSPSFLSKVVSAVESVADAVTGGKDSDGGYSDDDFEAKPKAPRVAVVTTPRSSSARGSASPKAAAVVPSPSSARVAKKAPAPEIRDEVEEEVEVEIEEDGESSPALPRPAGVSRVSSGDVTAESSFVDQPVEPIALKPAPATGSLKTKGRHTKNPSSVSFMDDTLLKATTLADSPRHSPEPSLRSPAASSAAKIEAEMARRAAEIDAMFPSDEDDTTTIAKAKRPAPAAAASTTPTVPKKPAAAPIEIEHSDDEAPKKKKHGRSHSSGSVKGGADDENTSIPNSPSTSPSRKPKKKRAPSTDLALAAALDVPSPSHAGDRTSRYHHSPSPSSLASISFSSSPLVTPRDLLAPVSARRADVAPLKQPEKQLRSNAERALYAGATANLSASAKIARPSSATRDGGGSRPSSASSRDSSRPSSASRSRPAVTSRPTAHSSLPSALSPIKSAPYVVASLDANKPQPFVIRDEDEGDDDEGSDLYEDIDEEDGSEASFTVQNA